MDEFASRSFTRAVTAQKIGFLRGEIVPVGSETFEADDLNARGIKMKEPVGTDTHIRPWSVEQLAKIRRAFGGAQTGDNSSAIVDGAAVILVGSAAVGVPPEIMGIGPVPAIRTTLERAGLALHDIDRFEINEAFGAQVMACAHELKRAHLRYGIASACIGGGQGIALLIENTDAGSKS